MKQNEKQSPHSCTWKFRICNKRAESCKISKNLISLHSNITSLLYSSRTLIYHQLLSSKSNLLPQSLALWILPIFRHTLQNRGNLRPRVLMRSLQLVLRILHTVWWRWACRPSRVLSVCAQIRPFLPTAQQKPSFVNATGQRANILFNDCARTN